MTDPILTRVTLTVRLCKDDPIGRQRIEGEVRHAEELRALGEHNSQWLVDRIAQIPGVEHAAVSVDGERVAAAAGLVDDDPGA